jgi:mRNA interferase YafQ
VRTFSRASQFRKDVKLAARRGKDLSKLKAVLDLLIEESTLPPQLGDHPLRGDWKGSRDCHIESDGVLIYTLEGNHVRFERTGTHSDLFE